jgi:hypothetical protein
MQPQYAAFVGAVTQGDLPVEGMASLYVEMAPGNWVFRIVDIAVKATDAKPGAQIVEREFGMFEIHSLSQADVLRAGEVVLEQLGRQVADRVKPRSPRCRSSPTSTPTRPSCSTGSPRHDAGRRTDHAGARVRAGRLHQLRRQRGREGRPVNLMHVTSVGRFGRLWMAGTEADILAARDAAVTALESLDGRS